jgi:hypothetical protein
MEFTEHVRVLRVKPFCKTEVTERLVLVGDKRLSFQTAASASLPDFVG